jgi:hypothetical protein
MGTTAASANCRRSLELARTVSWPAPRLLMLARVVSCVLGSTANWFIRLAPSAISPFQFMNDAPRVVRALSAWCAAASNPQRRPSARQIEQ